MEPQDQFTSSKEIITYLATHFPNCFSLEGEAKPLKIGIFQDIIARLNGNDIISKTKLRVALRIYTMGWRYLYSIKEGAYRVDLDGNPNDMITKEHVEHAQQLLKESKERVKNKRQETTKNKPAAPKRAKEWHVGDFAKVILSKKPIDVQIIQIEKEQIRVKVGSGMELTVKSENIISK